MAHYPSYCSKYNPIERSLFPHITRVCQGMLFETLETVVGLMRKASTRTGLRTTVNVIRRAYEIGLKVADGFKETMKTVFDKKIPKWNYRVVPQVIPTLDESTVLSCSSGTTLSIIEALSNEGRYPDVGIHEELSGLASAAKGLGVPGSGRD